MESLRHSIIVGQELTVLAVAAGGHCFSPIITLLFLERND